MTEKFEAKLFINESRKRIKKGLIWKKYADEVSIPTIIKNLAFFSI